MRHLLFLGLQFLPVQHGASSVHTIQEPRNLIIASLKTGLKFKVQHSYRVARQSTVGDRGTSTIRSPNLFEEQFWRISLSMILRVKLSCWNQIQSLSNSKYLLKCLQKRLLESLVRCQHLILQQLVSILIRSARMTEIWEVSQSFDP